MPEIKNQFNKGRMNKDVDERLVPNGEYRDAMNIQVSTSEGSDVGAVQNILGNRLAGTESFLKGSDICVGSIADEKNDALYWFVAGEFTAEQQTPPTILTGAEDTKSSTAGDYILEHKNNNISVVFADAYYKSAFTNGAIAFQFFTGALILPFSDHHFTPGDIITTISTQTTVYSGINLRVASVTPGDVVLDSMDPGSTPTLWSVTDFFNFVNDLTTSTVVRVVAVREKALGLSGNTLITGVNIIDDLLLWTDGKTEPRKINIKRSKEGTSLDPLEGTRLVVDGALSASVKKEHVTVIKQGPSKPPGITKVVSLRNGYLDGTTVYGGPSYDSFTDPLTGILREEGTDLWIIIGDDVGGAQPDLLVNDVIRMSPVSIPQTSSAFTDFTARVVIKQIEHGPFNIPTFGTASNTQTAYRVTIATLASTAGNYDEKHDWVLEETGKGLFKLKFPRFAYRYKYADNEYSQVGPFSEVVFTPGDFSYHPKKAFNEGMVNTLKKLTLRDFVSRDTPLDVVQIDLLYKEESSPSIYVITSISRDDAVWNAAGTGGGLKGSYDVASESIYQQLPANQLLRPWDNVPKTALAQEVVGNRVVYGNYTQGYDIIDSADPSSVAPQLSAALDIREKNVDDKAHKSIKSLRTYDFGIVYGDEFGRESPVFTSSDAGVEVAKSAASQSSAFTVSVQSPPPAWADYYKVFVKETSNEYYNLAMGRVYDASDGNVWISFPSIDRNKVDEDTYLILKKGVEDRGAVQEEARYKIVAIENEAPDYIKTEYTLLAEPNMNMHGYKLIGGSVSNNVASFSSPVEAPYPGHTSFSIKVNRWSGHYDPTTEKMGLPGLESMWENSSDELYVSFSTLVKDAATNVWYTKVSRKFEVVEVNKMTGQSQPSIYVVRLSTPVRPSESWITDGVHNTYADSGRFKPHFYKKQVLNKPEFDGRFFVKITDDDVIRANIANPIPLESGYKVDSSTKLFYLADKNAPAIVAAGGLGTTGNLTSKLPEDWQDLLTFNGNNFDGEWFIDEASFAGVQPYNKDNILSSIGYQGSSEISDMTGVLEVYKDTDGNLFNGPSGRSNGVHFKKGIHTGDYTDLANELTDGGYDPLGTNLYLSLSYSALNPSVGNSGAAATHASSNYVHKTNWNVGNSNNSFTSQEAHVTTKLTPGSLFRLSGSDKQVYMIQSATKRRLYNWRGHAPSHSLLNGSLNVDDSWRVSQESGMMKQHNRRLNYLVKYKMIELTPGAGVPTGITLDDNTNLTSITATNAGQLEFISKFDTEIAPIISDNPAIFETEPREDIGLDIYYEASSKIPTNLTGANMSDFISVGATLTTDGESTFPAGTFVTRVGNGSVTMSSSIINSELQNTNLKFTNDDGSYFYATTISSVNPNNTTVITIDLDTSQLGIGWSNCWSFKNGVESNRVGDTYNKPFVKNGVKASTILLDTYEQEDRKYGLIYSGIYNSISGVNNLNQFIAAEKITKDINPVYGSIQKLHAGWGQGGDLIALCEDRILKILANKDALYNADGNTNVTSTNNVLGTATPYSGEYGISKNPESFASEAYRVYFTDKVRGTVMRLSMDGLTPISSHGMKDWFRDNLKLNNTLIGSFDDRQGEYNLMLPDISKTVTFREDAKGWSSFKSFIAESAVSCASEYYTIKNAKLWRHHAEGTNRNTFYVESIDVNVNGPHPTSGAVGNYFWVGRQAMVNLTGSAWDGFSGSVTVSLRQYRGGELIFSGDVKLFGLSSANSINGLIHGRKNVGGAIGDFLIGDTLTVSDIEDFYTNSKLSVILNSSPGDVKSFKTIGYEGTQSKVDQNLVDDQYYNLTNKKGWYVDLITTDQEKGGVNEFINKEGKWFNYIKGKSVVSGIKGDISLNGEGEVDFDQSSLAIQGLGFFGTFTPMVVGCTDPDAANWNPLAVSDDGSCEYVPPALFQLSVLDEGAILIQGTQSSLEWRKAPAGDLDPNDYIQGPISISNVLDLSGNYYTNGFEGAALIPAGGYTGTLVISLVGTFLLNNTPENWIIGGATAIGGSMFSGGTIPLGITVHIRVDALDAPGVMRVDVLFDEYAMPANDTDLAFKLQHIL
tara:strand:+ start:2225 stop:8428 length:6204 start_codon:yes stop_codon:yes gene_type:complete